MEFKKAAVIWILYLTLFILFIVFFPKTCGKTDFISKTTEFNCQGIEAPFIKGKSNYSWCYGICMEKTIQTSNQILIEDSGDEIVLGPFKELKDVLVKKGPILLGIFFLVAILKWIGSLKKRKSDLVVYKKI